MTDLAPLTLLTRIDPEQNMRRFYRLELSTDLLAACT